jgi:lactoylglutathione lyase
MTTATATVTILYTAKPKETLEFYEAAFGLKRRFFNENPGFGELEVGSTTLAISNIKIEQGEYPAAQVSTVENPAFGFHVSFQTDDSQALFEQAVQHGATVVHAPQKLPWGGTVARLKDINGVLVSIMSR